MSNIVTSIDLGSNSFRVLKFDCVSKKSLGEFETTVGTADGLSVTGGITPEALQRVINAIKKSIEVIDYNPKEAIAVTTQALRIANNSSYILEEIKSQTGIDFTIIDGKEEGRLTLLAMQNALQRENFNGDDFVLVDIGGGSTELIIYQNEKSKIHSFPFGIVTLSQSKNQQKDLVEFKIEIEKFINSFNLENSIFISTAGTPTIITALKHGLTSTTYDKNIINGTELSLDEIKDIQIRLQTLSTEELISEVGMGREDFINTGILIYELFYKTLKKDISVVFDDGLREGVALNSCKLYAKKDEEK